RHQVQAGLLADHQGQHELGPQAQVQPQVHRQHAARRRRVKSVWERHKDPNARSTQAAQVKNVASLTAQDATTLNITLASPQPSFPYTVARNLEWIPSPTALAKYGATYGTSPDTTVGAGPLILKQWLKDSQLSFTRTRTTTTPRSPASTTSSTWSTL